MAAQIDKLPAQNRSKKSHPAVAEKLTDPEWAWSAYQPDAQRPWNLTQAGHLYRRAAFGANWEQLQRALSNGAKVGRVLASTGHS